MKKALFAMVVALALLILLTGCIKAGTDRNFGKDGEKESVPPSADSNKGINDANKVADENEAVNIQDTNTFEADDLNAEQGVEQTVVSQTLQDLNGNSYSLVLAGGALSGGEEKVLFELYDSNSNLIARNFFGAREDVIFYDAQGKSILQTTFYIKSISTAIENGSKKYFVELYRNIR